MADGTSLWTGKSSTGSPSCAQVGGYLYFVNGADKDTPWKVRVKSATELEEMSWGLSAPTFTPTIINSASAGNLTQADNGFGQCDDPYEYQFSYSPATH